MRDAIYPAAATALLFAFWELLVLALAIPEYLVPSPAVVLATIWENSGYLAYHTAITTAETIGGFALSAVIGVPLAVFLVWSQTLDKAVTPLLVLSQTFPKIAVAPLMIIWFGLGFATKVVVSFLVAFFPVVIAAVTGMRSVETEMLELVSAMRASTLQTFWHIRLPFALPSIFAGLKVAMAFAIVGAVVGEWVGSDKGLGQILLRANANLETPLLFAVLVILMVVGVVLYYLVEFAERVLIRWHVSVRTNLHVTT